MPSTNPYMNGAATTFALDPSEFQRHVRRHRQMEQWFGDALLAVYAFVTKHHCWPPVASASWDAVLATNVDVSDAKQRLTEAEEARDRARHDVGRGAAPSLLSATALTVEVEQARLDACRHLAAQAGQEWMRESRRIHWAEVLVNVQRLHGTDAERAAAVITWGIDNKEMKP